jgi:2-polyprenyl-6-hydroxyphenyl methylase/3-demethylubiquinone-9 3-methyltransferase
MSETDSALHPNETWNRPEFVDYYTRLHGSAEMEARVETLYRTLAAVLGGRADAALDVADIGCGPGLQALVWARHGHRTTGIDISEAFIRSARAKAASEGASAQYQVGSATDLPLAAATQDVCLIPELLEHVENWQAVVSEATRVLRPGGMLYISTSNWLCPAQNEFALPLYSWYPPPLKRHFERLARTTRPELANYATYPAVHWFSFYGLRRHLVRLGYDQILDRFDMAACRGSGPLRDTVIAVIRAIPPLRFFAHVASPAMPICGFRPV